ncbi:WXG100 family type VII secretion target [Microbispora sp. KK1-11]|uniref:WXG100 family type VII secretion target n=1 Tax=Microbispora sp. KK1-11 TaxID=2053005 RepID=UPI0011589E9F|nr:WXG100 family type VII secretion target [Microbispora sp. KK1-11]TQS27461.1 WXG100 family type VII secretion target [Microbispora sp. KK1-11]
MAERKMPIRAAFDASDPGVVMLDTLRTALGKTDPELIRAASGEFKGVHDKLKSVVDTLDKHLDALDKHWTTGDDAKQVKEQLRRLRTSTVAVMNAIVETSLPGGRSGPPSTPGGVVPALDVYASSLNQFRGENVPKPTKSDIDWYDAALEAGAVGAAGGAIAGSPFAGVGAIPGAVIGGVGGFIVGGIGGAIGSIFGDGPFLNLFGESKEEKDMKAAEEHLKKLTQATQAANDLFPASLDTDVPKFDTTPPKFDPITGPGGSLPSGSVPTGVGGPGDLKSLGDLGTGPSGDGLGFDVGGYGGYPPYGIGDGAGSGLGGDGPNGNGLDDGGSNGTGLNGLDGSGLNGTGLNGNGLNGTGLGGNGDGLNGAGQGTSLAAHTPQPGGPGGLGSGGPGTGYGTGFGAGGGYGAGAGGGAGSGSGGVTGVNAAGLRPSAGGSMLPVAPHGAGKGEEREERERTTWLLEDEDFFMSDQPTTSPRIDRA